MNTFPVLGEDISGSILSPPQALQGAPTVAVLAFPSQSGFLESTILRIRGTLAVPKSTYSTGLALSENFTFGIGIVSDDAALALAVPNPATATGYDWDGWMFLRSHSTTPVDPAGEIVDIKAMRIWKSGDSIVFVAGFSTDDPALVGGGSFTFSLRGLFLLP